MADFDTVLAAVEAAGAVAVADAVADTVAFVVSSALGAWTTLAITTPM
jgi:hypothetical protein